MIRTRALCAGPFLYAQRDDTGQCIVIVNLGFAAYLGFEREEVAGGASVVKERGVPRDFVYRRRDG